MIDDKMIADFASFINEGAASWAEYEFKAVVCGIDVGRDFCRLMLAASVIKSSLTLTVAEGILSSTAWSCFKTDTSLVSDILELYMFFGSPQYARDMPQDNIRRMAMVLTASVDVDSLELPQLDAAKMYTLLDAVERRFPLLLVKYYAANAKTIHSRDEKLAVWIKRRLSVRAEKSEIFRKIYESMTVEFVSNHLASAVFMK